MIMPRGQQLLLPANPVFIWSSLFAALFVNMVVSIGLTGSQPWLPDLLGLTLVFWNVHQPKRVSVGAAFCMGLVMDVHHTALLGQHALAYAVLSFLAVSMHRRLLWFPLSAQALHVLPVFAVADALVVVIRLLAGGSLPGWAAIGAPFSTAVLWPIATLILLAPQRRAPDPDENRPL